jgi:hypothetical protein
VDDRVAAAQDGLHGRPVGHAPFDDAYGLELGRELCRVLDLQTSGVRSVGKVVDDDDGIAASQKGASQVETDEPDPTRHDAMRHV